MNLSGLTSRIDKKVQELNDRVRKMSIAVEQIEENCNNKKNQVGWGSGLSHREREERLCGRLKRGINVCRFIFHLLWGTVIGFLVAVCYFSATSGLMEAGIWFSYTILALFWTLLFRVKIKKLRNELTIKVLQLGNEVDTH